MQANSGTQGIDTYQHRAVGKVPQPSTLNPQQLPLLHSAWIGYRAADDDRVIPWMIARMDSRAILFSACSFWPGFQKLWLKGDFHSLLVSLLFSWVMAIAWLATFVWPEWLVAFFSPDWFARLVLVVLWFSIVATSFLSAIGFILSPSDPNGLSGAARQINLETAQELYLQANYFEAERLVRKNSVGNTDDIESSLLWIAILRRTRRITQAMDLIAIVDKLDSAQRWMTELRGEKAQCLRIKIQTPPAHD